MKKPILIATGDVHLRDTVPRYRKDDFLTAQRTKIQHINNFQKMHQVPILCSGDLFDVFRNEAALISFSVQNIRNMVTVAGNHDLPYHSLNKLEDSTINILDKADKLDLLWKENRLKRLYGFDVYGFSWGEELDNVVESAETLNVAIIHKYVYKSDNDWDISQQKGVL